MIADALKPIQGVTTERVIPPIANEVPNLRVRWDRKQIKLGVADLTRRLREGQPSIELVPGIEEPETVQISSWTLQAGEAEIVARRLREVFTA